MADAAKAIHLKARQRATDESACASNHDQVVFVQHIYCGNQIFLALCLVIYGIDTISDKKRITVSPN
jgi:hypothetical protein